MHTSTSSTARSPSAASSSLSFSSLFQYAVFGVVIYILAGAPLADRLTGSASGASYSYSTGTGHYGSSTMGPEKMESIVIPEKDLKCKEHGYKGVYVLSREPLVVYIEGFLSEEECGRIVELSNPLFTPSTIWTAGQETLNTKIRHSEKAQLPRDNTVKCIEDRARQFQGFRPYTFIEKLWSQRYSTGGHYTYHYDWSTATRSSGRVSSFMVYLEANCTGGGTHFPRLRHPSPGNADSEWCKFIECPVSESESRHEESEEEKLRKEGVVFKPVKRNAVYWENMRNDGSGFAESWHAGLPVESGTKIGLNIWSWWQEGYVPKKEEVDGKSAASGGGQE